MATLPEFSCGELAMSFLHRAKLQRSETLMSIRGVSLEMHALLFNAHAAYCLDNACACMILMWDISWEMCPIL